MLCGKRIAGRLYTVAKCGALGLAPQALSLTPVTCPQLPQSPISKRVAPSLKVLSFRSFPGIMHIRRLFRIAYFLYLFWSLCFFIKSRLISKAFLTGKSFEVRTVLLGSSSPGSKIEGITKDGENDKPCWQKRI